MKNRRIWQLFAVLLAVFLLIPPTPANAAGAYTVRIADSSGSSVVTVKPGQQFTLVLSVENNPGIISVGVEMRYSAVLSLAEAPKNLSCMDSVASGMPIFSPELTQNPYLMWWNYALGDYNKKLIYESGTMAQVTFNVAADAAPGDYIVGLTMPADKNTTSQVDGSGVIQPNFNRPVTGITVVDCTVRIEGTPGENPKPTEPKPTTSDATKPTEATQNSKPTNPTEPAPDATETTSGEVETVTSTLATSSATEPKDTITESTDALLQSGETSGTLQGEAAEAKDSPVVVWVILAALGVVLATGGVLFFVMSKKRGKYEA